MTESNLYETPSTPPELPAEQNPKMIEEVATGQKMVIYAVLIYIVAIVLQMAVNQYLGLVGLAAAVLAILGIIKLAKGLGMSTGIQIVLVILMFIPLVSLITLLILNSKATERLKEAGYKVGLLGASK